MRLASLLLLAAVGLPAEPAAAQKRDATDIFISWRQAWKPAAGYLRPPDDPGWKARMVALRELVSLGPPAAAALAKALDDPDAETRAFAAQALGFLADGSASAKLERLLADDPDPITRLYAADALGMAGGLKSKPLYEQVMQKDKNQDVRAHVRFALERKGEKLPASIQKQLLELETAKLASARLGQQAPDFTLVDALDQSYRLSDFRGKKTVVLVFVYGDT